MALAPCAECGAPVSDRAPACPRCGAPPDHSTAPAASLLGRCGACGSDDVATLPAAYEAGTARLRARSVTTGAAAGAGGVGVFEGVTVTDGLHQGARAARLAPPLPRPTTDAGSLAVALGGAALAALGGALYGGAGSWGTLLGGAAGLAAGAAAVGVAAAAGAFRDRAAVRWNRDAYPAALERWRAAVVCARCGAVTDRV